jgi:protein-disulfide isomerase
MPSGKQSKRRRRVAQAPPPPTRQARGRRASPVVLIAAAGVLALIVIGVVLGVVLTSGSDSSSSSGAAILPDTGDVQKLFAGIPQQGNVLGKPSAPVTMVEYFDLQCPFCQQFETSAMPTLISRYVRPRKLKVEARPIAFLGLDSGRGQTAVTAAGKQNKLFNFAQLLYDNQGAENTGWLDGDMVESAAASIPGLDQDRFQKDLDSSAVDNEVKRFNDEASADDISSTPTILVGEAGTKPKPVTLTSPTDPSAVIAAVDAALG